MEATFLFVNATRMYQLIILNILVQGQKTQTQIMHCF